MHDQGPKTEHGCRALAFVWMQFMDKDGQRQSSTPAHHKVLGNIVALYVLAGQPGLFLTEAESAKVECIVETSLAHYNWLGRVAQVKKVRRWNTVMNFHFLGHVALQCKHLRCKVGATYLDKNLMGRMKSLAKKSYCGQLSKCPRVLVAKYIRRCFVRWQALE